MGSDCAVDIDNTPSIVLRLSTPYPPTRRECTVFLAAHFAVVLVPLDRHAPADTLFPRRCCPCHCRSLPSLSKPALRPPTLAPEFGCIVAHLALPIVPDDAEKRQAFLAPIAPRPPRWLPRSCPGLRPTTPSDGPRSCRPWSCRPSPRPRPPCSRTSCRRSGTTARGLRRVPPWRRTHRSVTAAMPRSSCQPCRPWRR